jgi:hypothetical protein
MAHQKKPLVFHVGIIGRGKGTRKSAVDAGAYVLGEKWKSVFDKKTYDYSGKAGEVVYQALLAPPHIPDYVSSSPYTLVHAVEFSEHKKNAQLLRHIYFALPPELTREQQIALLTEYVNETFVKSGMIALIALHHATDESGKSNPNAHILLTMRQMLKDGSFLPKSKNIHHLDEKGERIRKTDGSLSTMRVNLTDWGYRGNGEIWRHICADYINKYYQLAGLDIEVNHRSPKRQGLAKLSPVYMSQADHEAEKRGERTDAGNLNRWLQGENRRRANEETRKEAIDRLVVAYLDKIEHYGRRESWKSPQARATQQLWSDLHAIEEQYSGKPQTAAAPPSPIQTAQATRRERGPEKE